MVLTRLLRSVVLGVLACSAANACSALLQSPGASFDESASGPDGSASSPDGEAPVVTTSTRTCRPWVGTRLQEEIPAPGALFGTSMSVRGNVLAVIAPFEPNGVTNTDLLTRSAESCAPNPGDVATPGQGAVIAFEATASKSPAASGVSRTSANDWSSQPLEIVGLESVESLLPNDVLGGLLSIGVFPTYSVAVGDGVLAVGVAGDGASQRFKGSVRLFRKEATGWVPGSRLEGSRSGLSALFGMSVALSKDVLVVGAPGEGEEEPDELPRQGAVYVYPLEGKSTEPVRLTLSIPSQSAYLGATLAVDDDWVIAGAPGERESTVQYIQAGAVYAYRRHDGTIDAKPQRLDFPHEPRSGNLGTSLALLGDTLAVGAPLSPGCEGTDPNVPLGAVFLYQLGSSGQWEHAGCLDGARLVNSMFGWALALRADRLLISAPWEPSLDGQISAGVVYSYSRHDGAFDQSYCRIYSPSPAACASFGLSIAQTDDYTLIGAPYEGDDLRSPTRPLDSGGIYAFHTGEAP